MEKYKYGIPIRAYNIKMLAAIYGVSRKTFNTWIMPYREAIGPRKGYSFNPRQVRIIVEKLGPPCENE